MVFATLVFKTRVGSSIGSSIIASKGSREYFASGYKKLIYLFYKHRES